MPYRKEKCEGECGRIVRARGLVQYKGKNLCFKCRVKKISWKIMSIRTHRRKGELENDD